MEGHEMKLVDTSSWIEYLRDLDCEPGKRVEELVLREEAGWCEIIIVELWNGARGMREKRELGELEKEITLFPIKTEVWQIARQLARRCRDAGLTVPTTDIVIAACAVTYDLALEHCDSHYDKIIPIAAKLE